jgi:hypothetical protein
VKGSTIAEHLANNATNDYQLLSFDFHEWEHHDSRRREAESEWWIMQFDGVMNAYRNGSGRMIIFLCEKKIISQSNCSLITPTI